MTLMKMRKQKVQKSVVKGKLKFQDYKNCLEPAQIERKVKYLEKKKFNAETVLKKIKKNFKMIN